MRTWFRRCSTLAGLGLAAAALTTSPVSAQTRATFGLLGGADFTTIADSGNVDYSSSTGLAVGVWAGVPVAKSLVVEPELLYTNKGAGLEGTDISLNLNYIEIPILARYQFTEDGGPFAYIGPYVAFNVKCSTAVDTVSVSCADQDIDANTVIGGAIGVGFRRDAWGFDIRFERDFGDAIKQEGGSNSALMILLRLAVK